MFYLVAWTKIFLTEKTLNKSSMEHIPCALCIFAHIVVIASCIVIEPYRLITCNFQLTLTNYDADSEQYLQWYVDSTCMYEY